MQQLKSHKSSQPKGQNSLFRKARKRKRSSVEMVTAVHPLVRLQQTIGNQAVGRLIQTQLKVGKPGDKYEREADRVADTVMQMPASRVQRQAEEKKEENLQRQPEPEEKEKLQRQPQEEKKEELRKQPAEEKKEELRAQPAEKEEELKKQPEEERKEETVASKETSGHTPTVTPKIQTNIQSMRGRGKLLPSPVRNFFEPRFGYDFSQVRVHNHTQAAETAQGVKAQAFTVGRDVVFGSGQYDPETSKGKRLLAHELAHVVQQNRKPSNIFQRRVWGWPLNGYVENNSSEPVTVWSDVKGIYQIPANSTSDRFSDDVDHIKDKTGQWYKIGVGKVIVDKDGKITGYKCKVSNYGKPCP